MKKILFALLLLGFAVSVFAQREPASTDPKTEEKPLVVDASAPSVKKKKIRENTPFKDKRGYFRATGQRTTFYALDGSERYVCLENLNLERILRAMREDSARAAWKIDGKFTEFNEENYIIIDRAVVAP
jgi:hypothetical protein